MRVSKGNNSKKKLSIADINKNSSIEIEHTIRKIKEKEFRHTMFWFFVFLFTFISTSLIVGCSFKKISNYNEVNSNNLIIYNSKMKSVTVDKVGMSIDVLPTVLNLFGMEYDSRMIMGKDILSTSTGIAIFKDKSWVTNKGTYYASKGRFVGEDVDNEYINNINNIVNNRTAISRMIVANDYYRKILG